MSRANAGMVLGFGRFVAFFAIGYLLAMAGGPILPVWMIFVLAVSLVIFYHWKVAKPLEAMIMRRLTETDAKV